MLRRNRLLMHLNQSSQSAMVANIESKTPQKVAQKIKGMRPLMLRISFKGSIACKGFASIGQGNGTPSNSSPEDTRYSLLYVLLVRIFMTSLLPQKNNGFTPNHQQARRSTLHLYLLSRCFPIRRLLMKKNNTRKLL